MSCNSGCFNLQVPSCGDPTIDVGLTPSTEYTVLIYKPGSGKDYSRKYTTDNTGKITIDHDEYPAGFFAPGFLNVVFYKDGTPAMFQKNNKYHNCILMQMVQTDTGE